ncbi:YbaB/EbfC family DNA-binding protein [Pseudonocardia sp. ICBG1122]|nr:YbaB/EbfC family DNA-binding protein [Pseudonocardia pini]
MATRDDDAYFGADMSVDDALAQLAEERRKLGESTAARNEERTTLHAKDRSFSMTFDGRGEIVDMAFAGTRYRSLSPKELAALIVATMQKGRLEAVERMAAAMQSPALAGIDLVGIATGKADPDAMIDALIGPLLRGHPEAGAAGGPGGPTTGPNPGRS